MKTTGGRFSGSVSRSGSFTLLTLPSSVSDGYVLTTACPHEDTSAIIQNIILFLLAVPTSVAVAQPHVPLTTSDIVLGTASLLTLLTEFTADNQQNSYQNFKHSGGKHDQNAWPGARLSFTPQDAKRGFITRGLWAWSRHPNFLCEQVSESGQVA
jgi:steroid 5-alpha reductase family enzyme